MYLNLRILHKETLFADWKAYYASKATDLKLAGPQLCLGPDQELSPAYVYLISFENLLNLPAHLNGLSFLCTGVPHDINLNKGQNDILYTEETPDFFQLMNGLIQIYGKYYQWEEEMQAVLDEVRPLREIGEVSYPILGNPIYAQGASFQVLFHISNKKELREHSELSQYYLENYTPEDQIFLSVEDITLLTSDPEYAESIKATEPTLYSGKNYGFPSLFYNLRMGGTVFARVTVDEILNPIHEGDYSLVYIMCDYLAKGLHKEQIATYNRPKDLDYVMENLLGHHMIDAARINAVLEQFRWKVEDTYFCAVLRSKIDGKSEKAMNALAIELTLRLPSDCYLVMEQDIVFIFNLTATGRNQSDVTSNALPFLRDNLLMGGYSQNFKDFKNIYYFYQQAKYALTLGQKTNPTSWYFHFNDYYLAYMIHRCKLKMIPDALLPDGLRKLIEYDTKKKTDYTHLLKVYLEHHMNIADTIREEYIHRNTFLYRLSRIQEISKLNLDNADTRLSLLIGYRILEETENQIL